MNIQEFNNLGENYVLTPSQVQKLKEKNVVNPFAVNNMNSQYGLSPLYVLKKDDFAVNHAQEVEGEGGLGSGKKLKERFPDMTAEEAKRRRSSQIKNAQRVYRSNPKNREEYNAYMRDLYKNMAKQDKFIQGEPSDRFGKNTHGTAPLKYDDIEGWNMNRLEKARLANAKYRQKKRNVAKWSDIEKETNKLVEAMFKKEFSKRGRPAKGYVKPKLDWDSPWAKDAKQEAFKKIQKDLTEKYGMPVAIGKKPLLELPSAVGVYKRNENGEVVLDKQLDEYAKKDRLEYYTDAKAYKKKREKPKAPPVVSEKKAKEAFKPTDEFGENVVVSETKPKKERKPREKKPKEEKKSPFTPTEEKPPEEDRASKLNAFKEWKKKEYGEDAPLTNEQLKQFKATHPFWMDMSNEPAGYVHPMFARKR